MFILRLNVGLASVLAHLQAEGDWPRVLADALRWVRERGPRPGSREPERPVVSG